MFTFPFTANELKAILKNSVSIVLRYL